VDTGDLLRKLRKGGGLTQQALARRAGTSQSAVARYETGVASPSVNTFERLVRATGAELEFSTRPAPAADLSGEMATTLRRHRLEILRFARQAGASNVRIFGSVARGENRVGSDIDLLIDFDISNGLIPIVVLKQQIESLINIPVDVAPVGLLKPEVARSAIRDAVPL
jgi:predicted nucleotidyltransferase/DNA-binding XRE family transcriptional regulator